MKIMHICMTQYTDGWTYQENMLAKYHKLAGNEVIILTSMFCYSKGKLDVDNKIQFDDCNGCHVIRLKKRANGLLGKFPRYSGFYETLENIKPDIIFSHGCQYVDILKVKKYIIRHPNIRLFIDNHADFSNSATNWVSKNILHKLIWKYCAQKLVPYVKTFYGVLPIRVDFLSEIYGIPKEKCKLLVLGADDELVQRANNELSVMSFRNDYGISKEDFLIVTGGKIDSFKYQTLLLMEAIRRIDSDRVKLIVFGSVSPELKEKFMSFVDGIKVKYLGWVDSKESYSVFAAADLVVFPGRHSVFWEQVVAQGIPMIVKDLPGTHHIDLGGNVIFLREDCSNEIYETIIRLINNDNEYLRMKAIAKERGMKEFSYFDIAKRSIEQD